MTYHPPLTPHDHLDTNQVCRDIARLFGLDDDALNAPYTAYTTVYYELQGIISGLIKYARMSALREDN